MSSNPDVTQGPALTGISGETLLMHATSGWPSTLEELLDRRDPAVLSMGEAAVLRPARASSFGAHDAPQMLRLTTYTGRSIDAAPEQRFLTRDGWRPLSALSAGDAVAVIGDYPDFFGRGDTDAELVKVLAYLTAGGTSGDGVSPPLTDPDVRSDCEHAVNAKGDAFEAIPADPGGVRLQVHGRFGAASKVLGYLDLVGVHGVPPGEMFVPDFVFGLKRPTLRLFLNRLFTIDAQLETSGRIVYRSRSLQTARQVQHLLARFGVVALLRGLEQGGALEAVDLAICTKPDVLRFIDEIGFTGDKAHRAEEVRAALYHVRITEPPGRLGPVIFDRVVAVEPRDPAPAFALGFDTAHNFIANDFVVRAESSPSVTDGALGEPDER